jgi:chromate reductase
MGAMRGGSSQERDDVTRSVIARLPETAMPALRLLIFSGSVRQGSLNLRLCNAASQIARDQGLDVRPLNLRELALPVYDGDIEAASGVPQGAYRLQDAILDCDAMMVVTPEYNGFPTPLVINAFDWLSRIGEQPPRVSGLAATANRPVGLLSASPGPLGALRSMNFLRQYLQMAFAMIVVPQQFALSRAHEAFDDSGRLKESRAVSAVTGVVTALARVGQALRAVPPGP